MSQQLGIVLMIDVDEAIKTNTLHDNCHMYDNMKLQGSENQGTQNLVSAINGSYFMDGSQANEQVLNWLPYGVGCLPPTLSKAFLAEISRKSDLKALEDIDDLIHRIKDDGQSVKDIIGELKDISGRKGSKIKVRNKFKNHDRELGNVGQKLMDVTGRLITLSEDLSENEIPEVNSLNPIITNITGEAVDENIIYPAAYGSPDLVTDGWYWAASVDTSRPGTYAYTMHVQLYKLVFSREERYWVWVPVDMTCEAHIKISSNPKVNGFTGAGVCQLPIH